MHPRLRRLAADYDKIRTEFAGHPYIDVEPVRGNPPERYRVTYRVRGIRELDSGKRPIYQDMHVATIYLHSGYPREKPKCTLETPIWHPNFGSYICIGDHWGAGETLMDVIVQIGDMIQYKSYNPKSPLNGTAAIWAKQHERYFPVGNIDLYQPEPEIGLEGGVPGPAEDDLGIILHAYEAETDDLDIELH